MDFTVFYGDITLIEPPWSDVIKMVCNSELIAKPSEAGGVFHWLGPISLWSDNWNRISPCPILAIHSDPQLRKAQLLWHWQNCGQKGYVSVQQGQYAFLHDFEYELINYQGNRCLVSMGLTLWGRLFQWDDIYSKFVLTNLGNNISLGTSQGICTRVMNCCK